MNNDTGILLTNTGTPDTPTWQGVAKYLARFLSDPRVIKLPRLLWYPLLFSLVIPLRAATSARLYRHIWRSEGSPLFIHMQHIAEKLTAKLGIPVVAGMNYGNPSISGALTALKKNNIRRLIVIPLYPQYSLTSTASSFDRVSAALQSWEDAPSLHCVEDYADCPAYIKAVCDSIQAAWLRTGKKFLLFSYHGIPKQYAEQGDPYPGRCRLTTDKIVQRLGLRPGEYEMTFQSRTGPAAWLMPYTKTTLQVLPTQGITDIQVICPGFSVDCLETLEEMDIRGRETFMQHGGKSFEYIPALNESDGQMRLLANLYQTVQY